MKEYHHYSTQMMTNHTMRINDLSSITDADIYFILAPTSNQIMGAEHKPKHADDFSQAEDINKFYNLLDEDINL